MKSESYLSDPSHDNSKRGDVVSFEMTPERFKELRNWEKRLAACTREEIIEWFRECLTAIESLQKRKAAPTREQFIEQFNALFGKGAILEVGGIASFLSALGLLSEPEREEGWYWVRRKGCDWCVAQWKGNQWLYEGNSALPPDEVGPRIPNPPAE